jgi:hypothetical protein
MLARTLNGIARLTKGDSPAAMSIEAAMYATKRLSARFVSDELFMQLYARLRTGSWVDLRSPVTFSEKIQWLKLHWRPARLATIADKADVRAYVSQRVGEDVLVPVHGIYGDPDEIPFEELPEPFVVKPTHGSGWVIFCRNKGRFDESAARRRLRRWLGRNYYYHAREPAYQRLRPRIICEQMLLADDGGTPPDYKFFCFNGVPAYVQVDIDRFTGHTRNIYDIGWNRIDAELLYPRCDRTVPRPATLERMVAIARRLSEGFPFLRVDLYSTGSRVWFGEMTLYPGNGIERFRPASVDRAFGDMIVLPDPMHEDPRDHRPGRTLDASGGTGSATTQAC